MNEWLLGKKLNLFRIRTVGGAIKGWWVARLVGCVGNDTSGSSKDLVFKKELGVRSRDRIFVVADLSKPWIVPTSHCT